MRNMEKEERRLARTIGEQYFLDRRVALLAAGRGMTPNAMLVHLLEDVIRRAERASKEKDTRLDMIRRFPG